MAAVLHSASLPLVDGFIHVKHVVKCDHVIVWPSVGVQTKDDPRKVEQQLKKCSSLFFLLFFSFLSFSQCLLHHDDVPNASIFFYIAIPLCQRQKPSDCEDGRPFIFSPRTRPRA